MLTLLMVVALGQEVLREPLTPTVDGRPVIVHLAGRNHVVSITTGPDGPLYTAKTRDGTLLASGLTLAELQARHPEVYRQLHPAISIEASASVE